METKQWYKLLNMYKNGIFLTGKVQAIENIEHNDKLQDACIIFWENIKIIIPADEMGLLLDENEANEKANGVEYIDNRRSILRGLLGAEIDCIITKVDNDNKIAYASRIKAINKKKAANFSNIEKGKMVTANVIGIGRNHAILEIEGLQTKLPIEEIAWGRIYDIRDYIKVGDKKKVLVLDKEDDDLKISLRQTTEEPYKEFIEEKEYFKENGEYIAQIREIKPFGIFVELRPGITAMCNYPNWSGFTPKLNEQVCVKIKRFKKEKRFIDATIIRQL